MGFLNELKKLTRPYDDDDEEFDDFKPKAVDEIPVAPTNTGSGSKLLWRL